MVSLYELKSMCGILQQTQPGNERLVIMYHGICQTETCGTQVMPLSVLFVSKPMFDM